MKINFYTGFIPRSVDWEKTQHVTTGGIVVELAANIRAFLKVTQNDVRNIHLTVCTTEEIWDILRERYPFIVNSFVHFLDYREVLHKQELSEDIYWYDALRFQVLSTIDIEENTLSYWIDEDALILSPDLFNLCASFPDEIIVPKGYYVWNLEDLKNYRDYFNSKNLMLSEPRPENYSNTGTLFGGPSKNVKAISAEVLRVEKGLGLKCQPNCSTLEYISCYCFQEICSNLDIPVIHTDLEDYVWHYTAQVLPRKVYWEILQPCFPKDLDLFKDFYDTRTREFRTEYVRKTLVSILNEDYNIFNRKRTVLLYTKYHRNRKKLV